MCPRQLRPLHQSTRFVRSVNQCGNRRDHQAADRESASSKLICLSTDLQRSTEQPSCMGVARRAPVMGATWFNHVEKPWSIKRC